MLVCFLAIIILILICLLIYKIQECENLKISKQSEKERADFWVDTYKMECERKETYKSAYNNEIRGLRNENNLLKDEKMILELMLKKANTKNIPHGTVDAVKYAVKKSHPDNGGNSDDFIKFKKCLDELERCDYAR